MADTGWCSRFCVPSLDWAKLLLCPMNPQELAGPAAFKPAAMSTYLKYVCQAKLMAILSGELCSLWWHWSPCPTHENRQFFHFFSLCVCLQGDTVSALQVTNKWKTYSMVLFDWFMMSFNLQKRFSSALLPRSIEKWATFYTSICPLKTYVCLLLFKQNGPFLS